MTNKQIRTITAFTVGPLVLLGIIYLSDEMFFVAAEVFILIATYEFYKMVSKSFDKYLFLPVLIGSIAIPYSIFVQSEITFKFAVFLVIFLTFVMKLFSKEPLENTFQSIGISLLTVFYAPFLFTFLILLKQMNFHYIFYLLFIIWFSDSGAYIFGIKFGKHRMYEKISPKKSMEGLYAGIICGVLAAIIYNTLFLNIPFIHLIISGVLVSSAGVIGDLIESMFKRYADVKDSGNIFPGHGGMLDRIDSILLGAPVLYFYLKFISAQ
jgi:phosphatidate cytidylyltransferase